MVLSYLYINIKKKIYNAEIIIKWLKYEHPKENDQNIEKNQNVP